MSTLVEWFPVVGYEGIYEVSSDARVRSLDRVDARGHHRTMREIKPSPGKGDYLLHGLCKDGKTKTQPLHKIVIQAFIGPKPTPEHQVNHIDGDRLNNMPANLEWVTCAENIRHKQVTGTQTRGEDHPTTRLQLDQVIEIKRLKAQGRYPLAISRALGLGVSGVAHVFYGRCWGHV